MESLGELRGEKLLTNAISDKKKYPIEGISFKILNYVDVLKS